jgi:hypothetical protein
MQGLGETKKSLSRCNEASEIPSTIRELRVPYESLEPSDDAPHGIERGIGTVQPSTGGQGANQQQAPAQQNPPAGQGQQNSGSK